MHARNFTLPTREWVYVLIDVTVVVTISMALVSVLCHACHAVDQETRSNGKSSFGGSRFQDDSRTPITLGLRLIFDLSSSRMILIRSRIQRSRNRHDFVPPPLIKS